MNNIGPQYGWSDSDTPPLNEQEEQKLKEWHIRHGADGFGTYIASEQTPLIATVHELEYASLIVAAPDMLAALEQMNALMENLFEVVDWGKTFRLDVVALNEAPLAMKRAIAKAKGQTP